MAVRVKVEIKSSFKSHKIVTLAVVNSGYETESPEIMLPYSVAEELGYLPDLPKDARIEKYKLANGSSSSCIKLKDAAKVRVVISGEKAKVVNSDVAILEHAEEVLISDKLTSELGIALIDVGKGKWCFIDELKKLNKWIR